MKTKSVNAAVTQANNYVTNEGLGVDEAINKAVGDTEFAQDEMGVIRNEVTAAQARQAVQNAPANDTEFANEVGTTSPVANAGAPVAGMVTNSAGLDTRSVAEKLDAGE